SKVSNLPAVDVELFENALLHGFGVELYSFDNTLSTVSSHPSSWAFLRDEQGNILAGVHKRVIPAGTFFQGQVVTKERTRFYVYTNEEILTFEQGEKGDLTQVEAVTHNIGRLPFNVYT